MADLTQYAKLVGTRLEFLRKVPFISNPTSEQRRTYALSHGYKPYEDAEAPGRFYNSSYNDLGEKIVKVWIPWNLDDAKNTARDEAQAHLDMALARRVDIPCEGFENNIVYDNNALINALGLRAGVPFIDAKDGVHILTDQNVTDIKAALTNYRLGLYNKVTEVRNKITESTTVDEVERWLNPVNEI